MREIVVDTETTGLNPLEGDRIVEIGCVELMHHVPTGRDLHRYVNPRRDVPEAAYRVHGLSADFLAGHPGFEDIVSELMEFLGDAKLVIHNAPFDMGFINEELRKAGFPAIPMQRSIDTLAMARKKFPGMPNSLDALCRRFNVDNSARVKHGALLDAELLAEVYLEFRGGRQPDLGLGSADAARPAARTQDDGPRPARETDAAPFRPPRPHAPTADEIAAHEAFVGQLKDPLWLRDAATGSAAARSKT